MKTFEAPAESEESIWRPRRNRFMSSRPRSPRPGKQGSSYPATVSLALALCGDFAMAEDLAQEAFVAAYWRWKEIAG